MARISGALFSQATGSVGNLTLSTQRGRVIMKSKATVVANPRTAGQVLQRNFISRAVVAWKMVGNVVKSGITSLVQYGSQYNTFVSKNAQFFTGATFTPSTMVGGDLVGAFATIGTKPELQVATDEYVDTDYSIIISNSTLKNAALVGDKLKCIIGNQNGSEFSYSELEVTAPMIAGTSTVATFADININPANPVFGAIWVESADGVHSTSSKFKAL